MGQKIQAAARGHLWLKALSEGTHQSIGASGGRSPSKCQAISIRFRWIPYSAEQGIWTRSGNLNLR